MRAIQDPRAIAASYAARSAVHVQKWLEPLLGVRELEITYHSQARFLQEDQDGNRYPRHQQWIESPVGTILIDSRLKAIID